MKLLYKTVIALVVVSFVPMLLMGQMASISMGDIRNTSTKESYEALISRERTRLSQLASDNAYSVEQFFGGLRGDTLAFSDYADFVYKNYEEMNTSFTTDLYPDKNHTGLPGYGYYHPVYGSYADFDHRGTGNPYLNASSVNKTLTNETYREWVSEEMHKLILLNPMMRSLYEKNSDALDLAWAVRLGGLSNAYPWYSYDDLLKANPTYDLSDDDSEDYVVLLDPAHNPQREIKWLEPYLDDTRGTWMVSCVAPMYNYSEFLGTAGLDILLSTITKHVLDIKVGTGGYAFLLDSKGKPIAMPEAGISDLIWNATHVAALREILKPSDKQVWTSQLKDAMENSLAETPDGDAGVVITEMLEQKSGVKEVNLSGEKKFLAYAPIASTKWSICLVVPVKEVVSPAKETEKTIKDGTSAIMQAFMTAAFAVLFASVLAGVLLGYYTTKPIVHLTKVTKEVSLGNLDLRVNVGTNDEIGELSESFNRMVNSMKVTLNELDRNDAPQNAYQSYAPAYPIYQPPQK